MTEVVCSRVIMNRGQRRYCAQQAVYNVVRADVRLEHVERNTRVEDRKDKGTTCYEVRWYKVRSHSMGECACSVRLTC